MNPQIENIMRFLHNLFTALWIGGMLSLLLVTIPGIRKNKQVTAPWPIIDGIQKRLNPIAIISMVGLGITGMLLSRASQDFTRLFDFSSSYMSALSIKHILIILMVIVAVLRLYVNKQVGQKKDPKTQKQSMLLLVLNSFMGVVVLFLSSVL